MQASHKMSPFVNCLFVSFFFVFFSHTLGKKTFFLPTHPISFFFCPTSFDPDDKHFLAFVLFCFFLGSHLGSPPASGWRPCHACHEDPRMECYHRIMIDIHTTVFSPNDPTTNSVFCTSSTTITTSNSTSAVTASTINCKDCCFCRYYCLYFLWCC